jgi:hypothetical protein
MSHRVPIVNPAELGPCIHKSVLAIESFGILVQEQTSTLELIPFQAYVGTAPSTL